MARCSRRSVDHGNAPRRIFSAWRKEIQVGIGFSGFWGQQGTIDAARRVLARIFGNSPKHAQIGGLNGG